MSHALTIVVSFDFRLGSGVSVQNEVCIAISMGWGYCILLFSCFSFFFF